MTRLWLSLLNLSRSPFLQWLEVGQGSSEGYKAGVASLAGFLHTYSISSVITTPPHISVYNKPSRPRPDTVAYQPQYTESVPSDLISSRIQAKMGDVAVENPANTVAPHSKPIPSTIPNVENIEGIPSQGGDEYATLKKLQRHLEYIQLQEEYIKDEQRYVRGCPHVWDEAKLGGILTDYQFAGA